MKDQDFIYSEESSDPIYSEFPHQRSGSLDSLQSMESCVYDEESKALKEFANKFVDNVFAV